MVEGGKGPVAENKRGANPNDAVMIQIAECEGAELTFSSSLTDTTGQDLSRNQVSEITAGPSDSPDKPSETTATSASGRRRSLLTLRKFSSKSQEPEDAELMSKSSPSSTPQQDDDQAEVSRNKGKKMKEDKKGKNNVKKLFVVIESIVFVLLVVLLIGSLTEKQLKNRFVCQIKLWKWCVLGLVIFCGRLVTKWVMICSIYFIEINFRLKLMVLYYVDGLRRSARAFVWVGLVLLYWYLLFDDNRGVKRSKVTKKIMNDITRGLIACHVGTFLWMVKTYLFLLLVASRLSDRFFVQIQEAMFDEYVISTSSGPPLMEENERLGRTRMESEIQKQKAKVILVGGKRRKMKKISAWTMEKLINHHISGSKLCTLSDQICDGEIIENKIDSESDAKAAADRIFLNVALPGSKYIDEDDLLLFFPMEEVNIILMKLEAEETGKISQSDFSNWVANVYKKRTSLAHYLNNSREAMQELNRLFTGIGIVLIVIVWFLIVGLLTTKALVLILSQLLLAVFLFGNTSKNVFEAIIFLFITHPFDVGDRCVIDGVQMVVEEMHILTTMFLRYDNEKIFYPNSVLATKPISNFFRSTVDMRDAVEFSIDVFTPVDMISFLKSKMKNYLESKPRQWSPNHSVVVKQIKDGKMIMGLYITHIIIFENYEEKINRRSELVLELKKIFDEAGIRIYHVLPQEVQVSYVQGTTTSSNTSFSPPEIE